MESRVPSTQKEVACWCSQSSVGANSRIGLGKQVFSIAPIHVCKLFHLCELQVVRWPVHTPHRRRQPRCVREARKAADRHRISGGNGAEMHSPVELMVELLGGVEHQLVLESW